MEEETSHKAAGKQGMAVRRLELKRGTGMKAGRAAQHSRHDSKREEECPESPVWHEDRRWVEHGIGGDTELHEAYVPVPVLALSVRRARKRHS